MRLPKLAINENFTFASVDNNTTHTVKKSKCRHYFISFTKKATGKRSPFKRVTLKFIKELFNNILKLLTIKVKQKVSAEIVEFKSILKMMKQHGVKVTIGHLIKIEQGKYKQVLKELTTAKKGTLL